MLDLSGKVAIITGSTRGNRAGNGRGVRGRRGFGGGRWRDGYYGLELRVVVGEGLEARSFGRYLVKPSNSKPTVAPDLIRGWASS
jgi:hypothetical protein